jgi:hypothetical protein
MPPLSNVRTDLWASFEDEGLQAPAEQVGSGGQPDRTGPVLPQVGVAVGRPMPGRVGNLVRALAGSGQQQPDCCTSGSSRRAALGTAAAVASVGRVALMMADCSPSPT